MHYVLCATDTIVHRTSYTTYLVHISLAVSANLLPNASLKPTCLMDGNCRCSMSRQAIKYEPAR